MDPRHWNTDDEARWQQGEPVDNEADDLPNGIRTGVLLELLLVAFLVVLVLLGVWTHHKIFH